MLAHGMRRIRIEREAYDNEPVDVKDICMAVAISRVYGTSRLKRFRIPLEAPGNLRACGDN
jgi:hypothetical protein